jgi:hypothetical protein
LPEASFGGFVPAFFFGFGFGAGFGFVCGFLGAIR